MPVVLVIYFSDYFFKKNTGLVILQKCSNVSLKIVLNELIVGKGQLCDTAGELLPSQLPALLSAIFKTSCLSCLSMPKAEWLLAGEGRDVHLAT